MLVTGPPRGRGLALLLGWTGGSPRHVRKHAEIWHALGWRTACCAMSFDMTFEPHDRSELPAAVDALLQAVDGETGGRGRPVVPHVFSNGGALLMLSLLHAAESASIDLPFAAAVYDSAPSRLTPAMLALAAPYVIGLSTQIQLPQRAALAARHTARAIASTLLATARGGFAPPLGLFPRLRDPRFNVPRPELFVCSRSDALVDLAHVADFADARRAVGADVTLCEMDGSAHVAHYRAHPRRYTDAVAALVRKLGHVE